MLESLFKKISRHEETPAQVFSWEFCETLQSTFFTEYFRWSWSFSLKKFYLVGFHEKVFEWLVANEFLSNSKNISPLHLHFFLHFLHNLFFLLIKFSRPHHGQRIIQSNYQEMATKRCFCRFIGEIIRYERWFMKWCVRVVWNFWNLLWEFRDVCERRSVWNYSYYK